MSKQPENRYIARINKKIPASVYQEKMHNSYRGGTPDCYYEGEVAFWVEYKWVEKLPKEYTLSLSELQLRWLKRNADNGHKPWVILGTRTGGIIFSEPGMWRKTYSREELKNFLEEAQEIADHLLAKARGLQ